MSSASKYGGGSAIRGGIPVCFPQFGKDGKSLLVQPFVRNRYNKTCPWDVGPGKKHGFARNSDKWEVVDMQGSSSPTVTLRLIGDGTEDEKW